MNALAVHVGALGPMSPPGTVAAGGELRFGMLAAVAVLAHSASTPRLRFHMHFVDTRGLPETAESAVTGLIDAGATLLAGEFHSVVAEALLRPVERSGLPFICTSATMDAITARRTRNVFRIAPAQSYGWAIFADYLAHAGWRTVVALLDPTAYWTSGAAVLERRLQSNAVTFVRVIADHEEDPRDLVRRAAEIVAQSPSPAVLLPLVGYPEPLGRIAAALSRDADSGITIADPAGRPVFHDWVDVAGPKFASAPYLSYQRPGNLSDEGQEIAAEYRRMTGRAPTFIALEGADAILALASAVGTVGTVDPADICAALCSIRIRGTRAEFAFTTETEGVVHQQWHWPPAVVVRRGEPRHGKTEPELLWSDDDRTSRPLVETFDLLP